MRDGKMKVFTKEMEVDGVAIDPFKVIHEVRGVTAHEMTRYFWSPEFRFDYDGN